MTIPAFPSPWADRFADLPVLRIPSYECPRHDGDIALLEDLAELVFDHPARDIEQVTDRRSVYLETCRALNFFPGEMWLIEDTAAQLLKEW